MRILFPVVFAVLFTAVFFQNQTTVPFWFFGEHELPLWQLLLSFFAVGIVMGGIIFRRRNKKKQITDVNDPVVDHSTSSLSEEDRDFLS